MCYGEGDLVACRQIETADGIAVASGSSTATPEGAASIVEAAMRAFGRVDAVVCNAGIVNTAPFEDIDVQQWRDMLAVHLDGAFYLAQPAFRIMKANGYGRFVFTSSSAGMFGAEGHAHYAAAKTGLLGLRNVIAIEGAAHGILANNILPHGTTRMMLQEVGGNAALLETPMMRLFESDLVVPMVVYLASRACQVSHQDFSAAAGRYARVFTGLAEGWLSEPGMASADDIATHFDRITAMAPFQVPFSATDETVEICRRRGVRFGLR